MKGMTFYIRYFFLAFKNSINDTKGLFATQTNDANGSFSLWSRERNDGMYIIVNDKL
jgi:hypothetical protein